MNVTLKGFSQDVSLSEPGKVNYFLVFEAEGRTLRLPVLRETTEELAKFLYSEPEEEKVAEELAKELEEESYEDEDEKEAEEFGGDFDEELEDEQPPPEEFMEGPASEEEVPSL